MSAIERCRTAALGGHVERCEACAHLRISYSSCRNRHCPKCQAVAAKEWLADRQAELLPVPYFHVVFTLPGPIVDIAYQNKAVVYDLLLKVAAETLITIAADPKHLGARIGLTAVLHTWGSALTHHPHAHIIVPGGGFSLDGQHWIACRPRRPTSPRTCTTSRSRSSGRLCRRATRYCSPRKWRCSTRWPRVERFKYRRHLPPLPVEPRVRNPFPPLQRSWFVVGFPLES